MFCLASNKVATLVIKWRLYYSYVQVGEIRLVRFQHDYLYAKRERDCMRLAASGRGRRGGWHQLMRGEAGSTARRTQIELRFSLTGRGVVSQMGRCGPSLGCVSLHRSESKMSHTQLRVIAVGLSVLKLVAGQTTSGPTSAPTSAFFTLSPTIPDGDCGTAASDTQCMVSHMILQHTRWSFELIHTPHSRPLL